MLTRRALQQMPNDVAPCRALDCTFFGTRETLFLCTEHSGKMASEHHSVGVVKVLRRRNSAFPSVIASTADFNAFMTAAHIRCASQRAAMLHVCMALYTLIGERDDEKCPLLSAHQATLLLQKLRARSVMIDHEDGAYTSHSVAMMCYEPWQLRAPPFFSDTLCYYGNMGEAPRGGENGAPFNRLMTQWARIGHHLKQDEWSVHID